MANHRKLYQYKDQWFDIYQLAEMSGYSVNQLRCRMHKGYSIEQAMREYPMHDSVVAFDDVSDYHDWIGEAVSDVYQVYWGWCIRNELAPVSPRQFSSELLPKYNLHTVSMATGDGKSRRYIREKVMRDSQGRII